MRVAPLVSVIMPAYNCEDTIHASMLSALRQTVVELELIVIDDCSTDRTLNVITGLAASDSRVKGLRNVENRGVAITRNNAIDAASGDFLAFLDSDDLWEPDKLEKQLALIHEAGCDLCYSSYDYFDKNADIVYRPYLVPAEITYKGLLKKNVIGLSTVVLRKSALRDFRFNAEWFHEDFILWLRLLKSGIVARGILEVLCHNRTGGRSHNKWNAMKNRWKVYRISEELPLLSSCWYLVFYIITGLRKYQC